MPAGSAKAAAALPGNFRLPVGRPGGIAMNPQAALGFPSLSHPLSNTRREGDVVKIGDTQGVILQRKLLVTRLKTFKNEEITVPNSSILGGQVTNYGHEAKTGGLILHTSITIGYDAPWRKVHELLMEAADATSHVLKSPPPFILQTALNDFYVTYELNAFTDTPEVMPRIYSELHKNIQDQFNEAGVEIMSPHYSQLRDGTHTTIPQQYLASDYVPQPIRIMDTGQITGKIDVADDDPK